MAVAMARHKAIIAQLRGNTRPGRFIGLFAGDKTE